MKKASPAVVGILGFGALAQELVASLRSQAISWVALVRDPQKYAVGGNIRLVTGLDDLLSARPAAVVELAGHQAVAAHVPALLDAGIPVILASVGALTDDAIMAKLADARARSGAGLVIPSGAVGGLDYVKAVSTLPDVKIGYTSRKPPAAWRDELAARNLDASVSEVVLFDGAPDEAARRYPKNLNAAFTIAQAAWPARLNVRVVADPLAEGNTHEIVIDSAAGRASMRFVNAPSPTNPKSSMVTALSIAASLRDYLADPS
ncbi:aspartate dehydrogenase domain-containing protein [Mesorhizobium marinum]|uniref:aspartate dehydrogenase domain-containing protein n=1 Tax=Mesorhizobium marinum TaxID=3228790 RepID=UPI003465CA99